MIDLKTIGKDFVEEWNRRRNPDLTHDDLDMLGAFLEWLASRNLLRVEHGAAGDETAWLVERRYLDRTEYVSMNACGVNWTTDANKALRCCRREDAEQLAAGAPDEYSIWITEHLWPKSSGQGD